MATEPTVTVCVHARRFAVFLWLVETLHLCGVIDAATVIRTVERWSLPILAPYIKTARGKVKL